MDNKLQVFSFNGVGETRIVMDEKDEPWIVAKDVAEALMYSEASNPARLFQSVPDEWKGVKPIHTLGGEQEMLCLSEQGLYFFLGRSDKPAALPYQKWVAGQVIPTLRKTGTYSLGKPAQDETNRMKLAQERLEIQKKNANARLAKVMQRMVEQPAYALTAESKQILAHEITHLVTGREHPHMLPNMEGALFTATQVGELLDVTNRKIMKLAREMGVVAEQGQSNEFGRWKMTKSPHSPHECPQWMFTEKGRDAVLNAMRSDAA